ncbi:MAG TPA: hypothetical protein VM012_07095 [Flavitalea sp.]|nr:hypothetical protein [Flavitalea sp.]
MNNSHQNMEDRLWEYIDGTIPESEKTFIAQMVQSNQEWKTKYAELLEVHQLLHTHMEMEEPSMRFRQNVMEEIAKFQIAPATKSYINKKIIWGIGGFFVVMLAGFIVYTFSQVNWQDAGSTGSLPVDISKLDMSKVFNNTYTNIFIMVNVVLGLMLLDMYLNQKKKKGFGV